MSLGEDLRNLGNSYKAEKMGPTPAEVASISEWKCKSIPSSLQPAPEKMPAISRYSLIIDELPVCSVLTEVTFLKTPVSCPVRWKTEHFLGKTTVHILR